MAVGSGLVELLKDMGLFLKHAIKKLSVIMPTDLLLKFFAAQFCLNKRYAINVTIRRVFDQAIFLLEHMLKIWLTVFKNNGFKIVVVINQKVMIVLRVN